MNTLLKILLLLLLVGGAVFYYKFVYQLNIFIKYYEDQGFRVLPGAKRPLLGNLIELGGYQEACDKSEAALPTAFRWAETKFLDPETPDHFNAEDSPGYIMNCFGTPLLSIYDPEVVQELFTTKNKFMDKTGLFQQVFEDHCEDSFVFQLGDEHWKTKRKYCSQMFYKGRLEEMMNVFKGKILKRFKKWNAEIEASPDKKITIDMGHVWEDLFFDNIAHVSLGFDMLERGDEIYCDFRDSTSPFGFVRKSVPIQKSVAEIDSALI